MNYLKDRLQETSTLRGIVIAVAGLLGYGLTDAEAVQLLAAGQILGGIIGALLPDRLRRG